MNPDQSAIQIKLHESMAFLTKNADPFAILKDPFIERNWKYIVALSNEREAPDLFLKVESSWNDTDYQPFVEDIVRSFVSMQITSSDVKTWYNSVD